MKKIYRTISEVAEMLEENPSTLRFWEDEFRQISPRRSSGGKRLYQESDIEILRKIRYLLREKKLSIEGAREQLSEESTDIDIIERLEKIKRILE